HLAGLPGRRQMLYVGGPIPTASASLLFERWRDTFERSAGGDALLKGDGSAFRISGLAQEAQAKNKGFQAGVDLYGSLAEAASASGVVIHSLGLTTIRNSRDTLASRSDVAVRSRGFITASPDFAVDSRATLEMDEGLRQLSGSTGGTYFEGYKKADRFFGRVGYQLDHRYVIGFYAPATDGELEVKVTLVKGRRKLVRHRRLVRVASINQELATRTRAALLDLSDGDNRLGVKVEVTSVRRQEDQWVVAVAVAVPIGHLTLVDDGRRHAGQLWIYATAGDPARAPAKVMRVPLEVAVPRERLTSARSRDAEYAFELTSTEAPTRVAVTVRDDFGPDSATVGADVVLPEGS
ncbi:MAG: hypothetical protein MI919_32175, partial [Holophagales bacterium]|nr:hypothetical protein [Holophagales bacterium]